MLPPLAGGGPMREDLQQLAVTKISGIWVRFCGNLKNCMAGILSPRLNVFALTGKH